MKKAIVIGSGFGGLAIAIRLQASGYQVTIFEKNEKVGGHASQIIKDGYTFDLGPSVITAPDIIEDVFKVAGKKMADYIELMPLDPYYRIYFHNKTYIDYTGDRDRMIAEMAKFSKEDASKYDSFMSYISKLYKIVIEDGLGKSPFTWKTLIKFMPQALRLNALFPSYNQVKKYFKHPKNRFVFSFHPLFLGANAFKAQAVYLMIPYLEKNGGVWFSKGGMYSLVEAFEKVFKEIGGEIYTNSEVQEIIVENRVAKGVKVSGKIFESDIVVSNGHFAHTMKDLIKESERKKWTDKKIKKLDYSMSCFLMYIGTKKQYPEILHHTLILSERYEGLVKDIFDNKILADDFSMYLHAPTRTDANMAPPGHESMYVLIPTPNLLSDTNWDEMAKPYADRVLKFLEEDFGLKDLRRNTEVLEIFTPKDFEQKRNNYIGSAWGVEPTLTQTAQFRPGNKNEDIKNLYLVGASTHPGAGVPGVLLTAEATQKAILDEMKNEK